MKSNDIIVEYKIGDKARSGLNKARNFFRGKDYNPQDPDGLNKGDPKFGYPETPETQKLLITTEKHLLYQKIIVLLAGSKEIQERILYKTS